MTIYHTFISDAGIGASTILGIQQNGSEYGVGISSDIVCNDIVAGIISASQFIGNYAGIATFATTSGTSSLSQGLTGNPNISVGIVTATSYVATGSTSVFGIVGVSTVDANTTSFHYITYNTNSSGVNISNFTSGKSFKIVAENNSGGNRTLIIRSSQTSSGHTTIPKIVSSVGNVTNGTITISSNSGVLIGVFNMNGTVVGHYA
jgi:hypothetical protein